MIHSFIIRIWGGEVGAEKELKWLRILIQIGTHSHTESPHRNKLLHYSMSMSKFRIHNTIWSIYKVEYI